MFKKLFLLVMFLMLCRVASARDTMFVFIGSPAGADDTIEVAIDSWIDVPVYFQSGNDSVNGADMAYNLGINNCYFDEFDTLAGEFFYPLSEWDIIFWAFLNEDYWTDPDDCTWDNYSADGFVDNGTPPYNTNYIHTDPAGPPIHALTFVIHAANDPSIIGITAFDAIGAGLDPVAGPSNMGDPRGAAGYELAESFACYRFVYGGYFRGTVVDQQQQPIAGVEVNVINGYLTDTTDVNGEFFARALYPGSYNVSFWHPDYKFAIYTDVTLTFGDTTSLDMTLEPFSGYYYRVGDVNMANAGWTPKVIGSDVTYLVSYFRGLSQPCLLGGFFASADINGDCQIIGSDVTRLVNHFRGLSDLDYCPDYEPAWLIGIDCPLIPPPGWPGCE